MGEGEGGTAEESAPLLFAEVSLPGRRASGKKNILYLSA